MPTNHGRADENRSPSNLERDANASSNVWAAISSPSERPTSRCA